MILVDPRDGAVKNHATSSRCVTLIRRQGVSADNKVLLDAGDFAFDGWGPDGPTTIGVERKTLHDMLTCIDDGRYNEQRVKMMKWYGFSFLMLEGVWRVHSDNGFLMQEFYNNGKPSWAYCNPGGKPVLYSKLYNYLLSVSLSNVVTTFSRDLEGTCVNICNIFNYFQKKWHQHTALLDKQKLNVAPKLMGRTHEIPLVTRWAAEVDGIGVDKYLDCERYFKTPRALANGDQFDWIHIGNVSPDKAAKIVKQIRGEK